MRLVAYLMRLERFSLRSALAQSNLLLLSLLLVIAQPLLIRRQSALQPVQLRLLSPDLLVQPVLLGLDLLPAGNKQ